MYLSSLKSVFLLILITACTGRIDIPERSRLPAGLKSEILKSSTDASESELHEGIMKIVYIHGINCHNPDYSLPFQLRFADRLELQRSTELDGTSQLSFYTFRSNSLSYPERVAKRENYDKLSEVYKVNDPTGQYLVGKSLYTSVIPDSNFKKKDFDKRYKKLLKQQFGKNNDSPAVASGRFSEVSKERVPVQNYTDYADYCIGRNVDGIRKTGIHNDAREARFDEALETGRIAAAVRMKHDKKNQENPDEKHKHEELPRLPGVSVREFVPKNPENHKYKKYVFYEIFWSPLSEGEKLKWLQQDFATNSKRDGQDTSLTSVQTRAAANRGIKDAVLNAGIPDAVFYVGAGKEDIRRFVASALCFALHPEGDEAQSLLGNGSCDLSPENQDNHDRVLFISESLGSRIMFDALTELAFSAERPGNRSQLSEAFEKSMLPDILADARFYMFANQLPLLEIGLADFRLDRADSSSLLGLNVRRGPLIGERYEKMRTSSAECLANTFPLLNYFGQGRSEKPHPVRIQAGLLSDRLMAAEQNWQDIIRQEKNDLEYANRYLDTVEACQAALEDLGRRLPKSASVTTDKFTAYIDMYSEFDLVRRSLIALESSGPRTLDMIIRRRIIEELSTAQSEGELERNYAQSVLDNATFKVLAFSDPNDVLTYELSSEFRKNFTMIDFVNVPMRVAVPLLPINGGAGIFVNPVNAHLNFRFSKQTMDLILDGKCKDCTPE